MASGIQDPKPAASKPKAANTLEIKAEEDVHAPATGAQDNQQTHNRYGGGGGYRGPGGSGGRQGSGGGLGAGRGGHPGGSTRPCSRTSARAARRVQTRTTAQEAGLKRSEGQAPSRLAKRKSGGEENVRGLTQRKSGGDHGTVEVPGKADEVESLAEVKQVEERTTRTPDEGNTNSSAARKAAESILAEMEEAEGSGQPASTTAATAGSSDEADRAHTAEEDHRLIVKTLITEVNTAVDAGGKKQRQRSVQAVVAEARQVELAAVNQGRSDVKDAPQTVARKKTRRRSPNAT
ncbi:hypothetical protein PF003_g28002 [Phytophthora fragariae]|nr:hypothetical protein PF003_g28002 [Phytophthora fragariae]